MSRYVVWLTYLIVVGEVFLGLGWGFCLFWGLFCCWVFLGVGVGPTLPSSMHLEGGKPETRWGSWAAQMITWDSALGFEKRLWKGFDWDCSQNCQEVICWAEYWLFPSLTLGLASDEAEQVWVWEYETEEGAHDLYMDIGEEIRFRVVDETFVDTSPTGPSSAEASTSNATEEVQKKEAPYTLVVIMCIICTALWMLRFILRLK